VSDPTLEVMSDDHGQPPDPEGAADAAFDYRFDPETAEARYQVAETGEIITGMFL